MQDASDYQLNVSQVTTRSLKPATRNGIMRIEFRCKTSHLALFLPTALLGLITFANSNKSISCRNAQSPSSSAQKTHYGALYTSFANRPLVFCLMIPMTGGSPLTDSAVTILVSLALSQLATAMPLRPSAQSGFLRPCLAHAITRRDGASHAAEIQNTCCSALG